MDRLGWRVHAWRMKRLGLMCIAVLVCGNRLEGASLTLYVEPLRNEANDALREEMISLLRNQKAISVTDRPADADRVLAGTNQTYVKGYLSRNPRVRYRNSDSRPVYGGYFSVELKDQQGETVWSYLVVNK